MKNNIYKTLFWMARAITFLFIGFFILIMLNVKYMLWENFFPVILKIIKNTETGMLFMLAPEKELVQYAYEELSIYFQFIDKIIILIMIVCILYYLFDRFYKKQYSIKMILFSIIFLFLIVRWSSFNFLLLLFLSSIISVFIYLFFIYFYKLIPFKNNLALIPVIGDFFVLKKITDYIFYRNSKNQRKCIILFISVVISVFTVVFFLYKLLINEKNLILNMPTYAICGNDNTNIVVVKPENESELIVIDAKINSIKRYELQICQKSQSIACNITKNQYFIYDIETGIFYVLDGTNFKILKQKHIINVTKTAYERLIFSKKMNQVLLVFEDTYKCYIIDTDTLNIINSYKIITPNDGACFNEIRKTYLLTTWKVSPFLQEISPFEKNFINMFELYPEQGYIIFSKKHKEIYIAFHQRGMIYIYDAVNYSFKRKIKTNYSVKDIAYDEELDLLIAPSYYSGYVDIFLMDGSDKLIWRSFVGFMLREIRFDADKKNLIVASRYGLYKVPVDIKKIIKFHMKH